MKRRSVLKRQTVRKKRRGRLTPIWKMISLVGVYFIKSSCLVIALVMISLLFVTLYEYLIQSPYVRLERVVFSGVDEDMRGELIELAGLNPDLSLLAIDLKEIKESMEKHLWIRSVKPEKRFPHTLAVRAEKEEPRAVVVMDKLYLMNRWGEIFKEIDPMGELDFPIITGVSNDKVKKRKHLLRAAHVLNILGSEKSPWSLKDLSEVHVKRDGNISLYFTSFPGVIQARGRDFGFKIDDLKKVVEHLERTGRTQMVRGINLDYHDGAVVSFKNG